MVAGWMSAGCRDNSPPPPNVPVPTTDNPNAVRRSDPVKPLPNQPAPHGVEQGN